MNRPLLAALLGLSVVAGGCASPTVTNEASQSDVPRAGEATSGSLGGAERTEADSVEDPVDEATEETVAVEPAAAVDDGAPEELAIVDDSDPLDDVVRCTYLDSESIEIELVNNSPFSSSYSMTIAYFDADGQRLSDDSQYVESVRPTERAIEQLYVWDELAAASCEVLAVDRWEDLTDPDAAADVPSCEITGTDSWGDVEASLEVTNSGDNTADYGVTVGFFDSEGVRRGTGSAYVDVVRPGESAPSDVFTVVPDSGDYSCEVISVNRSES